MDRAQETGDDRAIARERKPGENALSRLCHPRAQGQQDKGE
jgi:hypothetical protein